MSKNDGFNYPYSKIYYTSKKESSRKKPSFFVHKYFARRITSNFRMSIIGIFGESDDIYSKMYEKNNYSDKVILDPFMGGGTTIYESCRMNIKTIGNDLQPLSKFVTRALIEEFDFIEFDKHIEILDGVVGEKIRKFYKTICPNCKSVADSMYYFHVKKGKINDEEHLFYTSYVLSVKKNQAVVFCPNCRKIHKTQMNEPFICECGRRFDDYKKSNIEKGKYLNKISLMDYNNEESDYPFETEIVAIEYYCEHCKSHDYKEFDEYDKKLLDEANNLFNEIQTDLPIPYQEIPAGHNTNQIINHGYKYFKDLFSKRQLLCLGMLQREINNLKNKKIQFWMQVVFSGMLEMNNMFCRYQTNAQKICNIFFNHAYVPLAMPVENNVWGAKLGTGTFIKTASKVIRAKKYNLDIHDLKEVNEEILKINSTETVSVKSIDEINEYQNVKLTCGDSRNLDFIEDNSVDAVVTDPPYGANVMYSELIDFFHVWNHMSTLANELQFTNPLSEKKEEIIVNKKSGKTFQYYQDGITSVFAECRKKLKDDGYLVFSFHDKSVDSWFNIMNSIFLAGYYLDYTFPVHSEAMTGAHTSNKKSVAIDMMLFSKKRKVDFLKEYNLDDLHRFTIKDVLVHAENLHKIKAELTIGDIQNIYIACFFTNTYNYKFFDSDGIYDEIKTFVSKKIETIDVEFSKYTTEVRKEGWWSLHSKSLWN